MGRKVRQQRTRVVRSRENSQGESNSAYWDHVRLEGRDHEEPQANPDMLNDERENKLWPDQRTDVEMESLEALRHKDLSSVLTPDESEILKLLVNEGRTPKEVERILLVPQRTMTRRLASIKKKLRNYLELED